MIFLCLAITSIGRAIQCQSYNWHHLVVQVMAFLTKYRKLWGSPALVIPAWMWIPPGLLMTRIRLRTLESLSAFGSGDLGHASHTSCIGPGVKRPSLDSIYQAPWKASIRGQVIVLWLKEWIHNFAYDLFHKPSVRQ
ncbi:hypothetical protein BJ165DRAFT_333414 [Panaeolus papilionaceus]|nr:hypothetical protein BJ165DRAFT_671043 [Panaeolus papilionaceus]KAF9039724.1 hypothetical protein BJ165DRAFT_333414 [Panaeolus papilionaceus]